MRKIILYLVLILFTGVGCSKKNTLESNGTIRDLTGFDGCSLMIVLDSGEKLEIISLPSNTTLIPDRRVFVEYKAVPRMSICMAGTTAEILTLRYL
jgi:hypothetical protein